VSVGRLAGPNPEAQEVFGSDLEALTVSQFGPRAVLTLRMMFQRSRHPMLITDDQRHLVAGNTAASELLGIGLEDFPWSTLDGFTPPNEREILEQHWEGFLSDGGADGWYTAQVKEAGEVSFEFSATANVLPGRHLFIWIPEEEAPAGKARREAWCAIPAAAGERQELTDRERVVVGLLAEGLQTKEMAERLYLSPETVKTHVQNAMTKLGAHTRAGAVALALVTAQIPWSDYQPASPPDPPSA